MIIFLAVWAVAMVAYIIHAIVATVRAAREEVFISTTDFANVDLWDAMEREQTRAGLDRVARREIRELERLWRR